MSTSTLDRRIEGGVKEFEQEFEYLQERHKKTGDADVFVDFYNRLIEFHKGYTYLLPNNAENGAEIDARIKKMLNKIRNISFAE